MRRRDFIALGGAAAAAWPVGGRAESNLPVVGILSPTTRRDKLVETSFVTSLRQAGFVEGQTVAFEYRFAENRFDRLSSLAADLVRRKVALIFTASGTIAALAAKAATSSIPIVFVTGGDPIKAGLIASLNRPGGNITGISLIAGALNEKRLELLHEVVPKAAPIAVLYNPNNPNADPEVQSLMRAAQEKKLRLHIFEASAVRDIDDAFLAMIDKKCEALLVMTDPYLNEQFDKLTGLAARQAIPAVYGYRDFAEAGGLLSYGTSVRDAQRQAGLLAARILQGERPAELPVQQATKVELIINLKTAKALGLTFPISLLGRADEVIE